MRFPPHKEISFLEHLEVRQGKGHILDPSLPPSTSTQRAECARPTELWKWRREPYLGER